MKRFVCIIAAIVAGCGSAPSSNEGRLVAELALTLSARAEARGMEPLDRTELLAVYQTGMENQIYQSFALTWSATPGGEKQVIGAFFRDTFRAKGWEFLTVSEGILDGFEVFQHTPSEEGVSAVLKWWHNDPYDPMPFSGIVYESTWLETLGRPAPFAYADGTPTPDFSSF